MFVALKEKNEKFPQTNGGKDKQKKLKEINKSYKENQEKAIKRVKEMMTQDSKTKIETIKRTQIK